MATKIDKIKLAQTINDLPDLDSETKSQLLQLIHERKQYGLVWEEHHEEVEQQMRTQLPVLVEDKSKFIDSADPHAPNHILIEGDNLPALTTLTYTHKEKIDVIYIDPPYNTGNKDFIYNDHFVGTDDDYRHSKWLSFMSKRLRIAKTLLSDKGVIFISIDDNEQAQLKMLCDEIFGAGNFVAKCDWRKKTGANDAKDIAVITESILIYAKNKEICVVQGVWNRDQNSRNKNRFRLSDEYVDIRGKYYLDTLDRGGLSYSDSLNYGIKTPDGGVIYPNGRDTYINDGWIWKWSKDKVEWGLKNGFLEFVRSNKSKGSAYTIKYKVYEFVDNEGGIKEKVGRAFSNLILDPINQIGNTEMLQIFGGKAVFSNPKPLGLIMYILNIINSPITILDFFAGSGTTLHATMQLNAEDGGHRQCILITNNENNICEEVTYERNKRVIQGYTTPKGESVAGLTANKLRYYRTDFVARESSLTAKKQLMLAATDLLCIKESIYTECHTFGNLRLRSSVVRYFADANARMLIIYNPDAIDTIVAEINRMNIISPIRIYVFSANDYAYNADFEAVDNKVSLCALPAAIYNAYRKVLPKKQQTQDEPATTDTELTFEEDTL